MEVICVGMPRSGTESLQQALLTLGYDYTFHGFDMTFEEEMRLPGWTALARKKWYGDKSGTVKLTAEDFDALLGHSVAVTDTAASCFAVELIDAYPEAKVVLNMRRDLDAWHKSAQQTLLNIWDSNVIYLASWFDRELFWCWHGFLRYFLPILFRAPDGDLGAAIRKNGKLVYRGMYLVLLYPPPPFLSIHSGLICYADHCNMIRGLVPKERLLEWNIGDGWEPLCQFLGKPVPKVEFPHTNATGKGWKEREKEVSERWVKRAGVNVLLIAGALGAVVFAITYKW
jgi:hypothetical protein